MSDMGVMSLSTFVSDMGVMSLPTFVSDMGVMSLPTFVSDMGVMSLPTFVRFCALQIQTLCPGLQSLLLWRRDVRGERHVPLQTVDG